MTWFLKWFYDDDNDNGGFFSIILPQNVVFEGFFFLNLGNIRSLAAA